MNVLRGRENVRARTTGGIGKITSTACAMTLAALLASCWNNCPDGQLEVTFVEDNESHCVERTTQ